MRLTHQTNKLNSSIVDSGAREQLGAAGQMQQFLAGEGGEGGGHQVSEKIHRLLLFLSLSNCTFSLLLARFDPLLS